MTEPAASEIRTTTVILGPSRREPWAVFHALLVAVAAAWMFGGKIWWAKPILCVLTAPAIAITVWEYVARRRRPEPDARTLFRWLLPMIVLGGVVLVSAAVPNLAPKQFGTGTVWVVRPLSDFWPSTADPTRTIRELWLLSGLYLTGFNLLVCVRSRHALRGLMLALAANGIVLSVFGTLQKLLHLDIFFGLERAPNPAFFATFIYHNHWGAYIVLLTSIALGLVFHYASRPRARDFWHTPACGGILAVVFMAATVPLSSSRSSTVLVALLLVVALIHGIVALIRTRAVHGRSGVLVSLLLSFAVLTGLAIYHLGKDTIDRRIATTRSQIATMRLQGDVGQRRVLYQDTMRMAAEKPWFGWGLESYERVFPLYNSTPRSPVDRLPIYYQEAHSDWLQVLAELGWAGFALLVAAAAWPLASLARRVRRHALSLYPILGCSLILGYAWVEFPLANPAVVAVWWIAWFVALRYSVLSENR
ncbi:MAG: O-antigen ligase family protein [Opitutaceae bacterium]